MVKSTSPNGGVIVAISIFTNINTENHNKSMPKVLIIGIKIGIVIIRMDNGSIKAPMIIRIICITITYIIGAKWKLVANLTKPSVAPVKAKIYEKAAAPVRIMNIITVTRTVPVAARFSSCQSQPL